MKKKIIAFMVVTFFVIFGVLQSQRSYWGAEKGLHGYVWQQSLQQLNADAAEGLGGGGSGGGATGPTGPAGPTGATGPSGPTGPTPSPGTNLRINSLGVGSTPDATPGDAQVSALGIGEPPDGTTGHLIIGGAAAQNQFIEGNTACVNFFTGECASSSWPTIAQFGAGASTALAFFDLYNGGHTTGNGLGNIQWATSGVADAEKRGALINATLTTSSGSHATARLGFWTNNLGTVAEQMGLWPDGGLSVGTVAADPGTGVINATGGYQIGGSTKGFPFANTTVSATAPTAIGCTDTTVAVASSTTSMSVIVTPQTNPNGTSGAVSWSGYVSTAGTVDVRVCNFIIETTPPATTYNVQVLN